MLVNDRSIISRKVFLGTQEYQEQIILVCVSSIHLNTPTVYQVKTNKMVRFCLQAVFNYAWYIYIYQELYNTTLLQHYSLLLHCILMRPCRVLVRTCFGLSRPTSPTFIHPSHSSTTSFLPHSKCSNVLLVYSMHTFDICAMQKSLRLCAATTFPCVTCRHICSFSVFKWTVRCCILLFMQLLSQFFWPPTEYIWLWAPLVNPVIKT